AGTERWRRPPSSPSSPAATPSTTPTTRPSPLPAPAASPCWTSSATSPPSVKPPASPTSRLRDPTRSHRALGTGGKGGDEGSSVRWRCVVAALDPSDRAPPDWPVPPRHRRCIDIDRSVKRSGFNTLTGVNVWWGYEYCHQPHQPDPATCSSVLFTDRWAPRCPAGRTLCSNVESLGRSHPIAVVVA